MSLHPSNTIIVYILIFVNDYFSIITMKECISHAKHGRFPHRNNIFIICVYICFTTPFACLFEYISYSTKNMQNITRGKCQENTIKFLKKIFLTLKIGKLWVLPWEPTMFYTINKCCRCFCTCCCHWLHY